MIALSCMLRIKAINGPVPMKMASLLKERGMSISQASKIMGISNTSLSKFLNGRTSLKSRHLFCLLEILGIDLKSLLDEKLSSSQKEGDIRIGRDVTNLMNHFNELEKRVLLKEVLKTTERKASKNKLGESYYRLKHYLEC